MLRKSETDAGETSRETGTLEVSKLLPGLFFGSAVVERSRTGRFPLIPIGHKTPRMLGVEQRLEREVGKKRTVEEDYLEFYIQKGCSQKALAARWDVPRKTVFFQGGKSPCWVQRLRLPVRAEGG